MTRVAIIGNAGGGKSTLCRHLSKIFHLPIHSIDKIQWQPGWVAISPEEFHQKHAEILSQERWIIDGWGPFTEIDTRFQAADTIIFIDHPLHIHYWWSIKRQISCLFHPYTDGPAGCPMLPMTWKLLRMIWTIHQQGRPFILQTINKLTTTKRIIHIRSPHELHHFIHTL